MTEQNLKELIDELVKSPKESPAFNGEVHFDMRLEK